MRVGLKPKTKGALVERLHRVLAAVGFHVEGGEVERSEFGHSTLEAVHELQRQHGLAERDEIDEPTHVVLIELEQKIDIDIDESKEPAKKPPPKPLSPDKQRGSVYGKLTDADGAPLADIRVSLFAKHVRSETPLDGSTTNKQGQYRIKYRRPSALNLVVRGYDESDKVIAESATVFAAPPEVEINFSTAPGGAVRKPSVLTTLSAAIAAQLQDIPLSSLKENNDSHELRFLANAVGANFDDVAYLCIATILSSKHKIQPATFFGIFYEGVPVSLDAALASLPDAGVDDTFVSQVLSGILAHSHNSLSLILNTAITANVVPASYASALDSEIARLDSLRAENVGNTPYVRGKTSLNDLLAAGSVPQPVQSAFVQAYADNNGQLGPTWKTLRANKNLSVADLATLNTTLSLGELLTGNVPLIKDTIGRLSEKTLASAQDLALLDENDWIARITEVDTTAASIPSVLPDDTPAQRIARFAKALAGRFASRYPTTAFAGGLSKAKASSFRAKEELVTFLTANPKFELRNTNVDQYIQTKETKLSSAAVADLKTAQRLFRISPHYSTVEAMKGAGHLSAQSVYFSGPDKFIADMTEAFGSVPLARMAHTRAHMTYGTALVTFARFNSSFHRIQLPVMGSKTPAPEAITQLPDLQALFGSLDYFQCEDCQSVYSPAAYLVDLLQYLGWFSAKGGGVTNARDAVLLRRPDIQYVALDCNNTEITLPYIDLVNEILEAAIAPPNPPIKVIETTGTSEERRALPQTILQPAYNMTQQSVFPLILPFDLPFAETTDYIGALGTTRAEVLALFARNSAQVDAPSIACARLLINPEMQKVINGSDPHQPWELWGLALDPAHPDPGYQDPAMVIDPKTRNTYMPSPANWVAALSKVPILLDRTRLSLQNLYQLLEVVWVTQSAVVLKAGTTTIGGLEVLSPSLDDMVFAGLTSDVLDRANRFLRLWSASELQMWELDWALETAPGGSLDDRFIVFLANAIAVQKKLKLPFQEVLGFWMPLEARDVTNHLGNEDMIAPSTYSEVFRNPAVLMSSGDIFLPASRIGITDASNSTPIVITTAASHGFATGQRVYIGGVLGNTAANGWFTITVTDTNTFTLDSSAGNGNFTSAGTVTAVVLSGNAIIPQLPGAPTDEQIAITASLGLSAADIGAILAFSGAPADAPLTADTLNELFRYQRLGSALSLNVSDLILWIQLTNGTPFGSTPADTLEFLRRLAVLKATALTAHDLDYLLRDQSANQSSLAFTQERAKVLLQAIRDAIAKLPVPIMVPITGASNDVSTPIAITTGAPPGFSTGQQVDISGVLGNTAANGTFSITVTGANTFTLDGTGGTGDAHDNWTGGGQIITVQTSENIKTIFIAALAAATSTTANVVTPILAETGVLPLDPGTINKLVAQIPTVDPTQFPDLTKAFTLVAKAAALFTALKPTEAEFSFLAQNADAFGWVDPGALPLNPTSASPYDSFEASLRALRLNRRQSARSPRLFDILGQWLAPNPLPSDLAAAIGGPTITITAASYDSPIAVTSAAAHGLQSGEQVTIGGVEGNTSANGTFTITVIDNLNFILNGSKGNAAYVQGGTVTQPSLAFALGANVNDVMAIATALNATVPRLTQVARAGSLADMAMLADIAAALDVCVRYGISGAALVGLASVPATAGTASSARGTLQSQYAQSDWFGAIQPVEDTLRGKRRDALVAYLLGPGTADPVPPMLTPDDIYDYYLIDPEMCPCALTTRLLQASLAIQQFVQQCFLNLFFSDVTVNMSDLRWSEWSWRQQYRLWQANRMVFLYPENYVLPETYKSASPFLKDLENELRQTNCDADAAEAAIENYLRKLVGVSQLQVAAHYNQTKPDGSAILHVFAHTAGTPPQWYYRTRTGMTTNAGSWSAWQQLNLDISVQHLVPVVWDQRLFLAWPVFKQIAENPQASSMSVPDSGSTVNPAQTFWTVQFTISELSAGQWQRKQTLDQKLFLNDANTPLAYTFTAAQDSLFNLQLQVYLTGFGYWNMLHVANGTLQMPESPLSVIELEGLGPASDLVDLTQEPTFAKLAYNTNLPGLWQLPTPTSYGFSGQDLVYGDYSQPNPGIVPLNILCQTTANGQSTSLPLLGTITNPRIVIPQQEQPSFDSLDPFFVCDPTRTYLVHPTFYTLGSSPKELPDLSYISQWNTRFEFQTFYHPYARTFLRELEIGGVKQLMSRSLQTDPQTVRNWTPAFNFHTLYNPLPPVASPYPGVSKDGDAGESFLDFAPGSSGAYSLYNWEIFYHIPMFIASLLLQNQQFQDAITWLEYIFNPTDASGGPSPRRYWQTAPFYAMNARDWISQQIQNLLTTLTVDTQQGISDPGTTAAILNWMQDPFDPHAVAGLRPAAYAKATVMKFLDVLIAWGDWYYSQYTAEMVSQAEQLYVLADMILGPKPQMLRPPAVQAGRVDTITYASLKDIDLFSNVLVNVENIIVGPEPPHALYDPHPRTYGSNLPYFPPGTANATLLFCIPPNDQLLEYWDKVEQRLYNIRHCLNLQGIPQPLPLYAPPINPLALIESQTAGAGFSSATPPAPIYRFAVYLQKAIELTNDVRAYGSLILAALEKQDAEMLAVLRANQELDIQTRILDVKTKAVTEANDQITALQNQETIAQIRYNFYSTRPFMNLSETAAIALQASAMILNGSALPLESAAAFAHLSPDASVGIAGYGGTPSITASAGGEQMAALPSAFAGMLRSIAGLLTESAAMAATTGGYQHRMDDSNLQANVAKAEKIQIDSQIAAAQDRLEIAQNEVSIQTAQISNAQRVSDVLTNKYTNAQLYNWMVTQLTTVYAQAYQLAFSLAMQAQNAYQYELGNDSQRFIQFGYWNSQYKGLTAGESLLFDLRRMEAQYLAENSRELEMTKRISLALTSPLSLVMLRETGQCQIALDEILYDYDRPGQYFRRLRSVALTIPCVTGPYTGVNATLTRTKAMVRTLAPDGNYQPQKANADPPAGQSIIRLSPNPAVGTQTIATSSGQTDLGLFEDNLHDERWRPFEGQGAICTMNLVLDPRDNNFDFTTITDVILTVRYTARGGDQTAAGYVRAALKNQMPQTQRAILISTRHSFPGYYHKFFNPDPAATQQALTLPLTKAVFPFSNLATGTAQIQKVAVYVPLSIPADALSDPASYPDYTITAQFSAPDTVLSLTPMQGKTNANESICALTGSASLTPFLAAPQTFTITVQSDSIKDGIAKTVNGKRILDQSKVEDILLVITYSIG